MTLSATAGERLKELAREAEVKPSTFCAHILERYALQSGHELMSNDVLIARLEKKLDEHNTRFNERYGNVLLRIAHEVVAGRLYDLEKDRIQNGKEKTEAMREDSWQYASTSLRKYVKEVRGEKGEKSNHEKKSESGGER